MSHGSEIAGVELITGVSYLLILIGFALRNITEGGGARLLWPWMLVSIFGLCGLTRLDYVGVFNFPDFVEIGSHLTLAAVSLAYGAGQLVYACWPELFEEDAPLPVFASSEVGGIENASPAEQSLPPPDPAIPDR